jgi:hypothetical protein
LGFLRCGSEIGGMGIGSAWRMKKGSEAGRRNGSVNGVDVDRPVFGMETMVICVATHQKNETCEHLLLDNRRSHAKTILTELAKKRMDPSPKTFSISELEAPSPIRIVHSATSLLAFPARHGRQSNSAQSITDLSSYRSESATTSSSEVRPLFFFPFPPI